MPWKQSTVSGGGYELSTLSISDSPHKPTALTLDLSQLSASSPAAATTTTTTTTTGGDSNVQQAQS